MSYWSEWALMGLPESTSKTHREKEKKKHKKNSLVFQLQPCLVCPQLVRALRAQFEEDDVTLQGSISPGSDQSLQ